MDNRIKKNLLLCENSGQEVLSKIQNLDITAQNWRKDNNVYVDTKFITLQKQINDLRALISEDVAKPNRKIATENVELMNQMKQMISQEVKDFYSVLRNNIIKLREILKKEIRESR